MVGPSRSRKPALASSHPTSADAPGAVFHCQLQRSAPLEYLWGRLDTDDRCRQAT